MIMSFERGWHAIEFKEYLSGQGKLSAIKTLVRRGTTTLVKTYWDSYEKSENALFKRNSESTS